MPQAVPAGSTSGASGNGHHSHLSMLITPVQLATHIQVSGVQFLNRKAFGHLVFQMSQGSSVSSVLRMRFNRFKLLLARAAYACILSQGTVCSLLLAESGHLMPGFSVRPYRTEYCRV